MLPIKMQHPGGGGHHAGPRTDLARLKLQEEGHWGTERWKDPGFDWRCLVRRQAALWECAIPLKELPEPEQENSGTTEFVKGQEMKWTDLGLQSLHENVPPQENWCLALCSWTDFCLKVNILGVTSSGLWLRRSEHWFHLLPIYGFWERCLVFLMVWKTDYKNELWLATGTNCSNPILLGRWSRNTSELGDLRWISFSLWAFLCRMRKVGCESRSCLCLEAYDTGLLNENNIFSLLWIHSDGSFEIFHT